MQLSSIYTYGLMLLLLACGDEANEPPTQGPADLADMGVDAIPDASPPTQSGTEIITTVEEVTLRGAVGQIEIELPENVVSATVILTGEPNGWYGIDRWMAPNGMALVQADWPGIPGNEAGCFSCPIFVTQSMGVSTTVAPNRPNVELTPGRHQIDVVGWLDGFAADTLTATLILKIAPVPPVNGIVDLNLYFTGAQGWSAATAQQDPYFNHMIDRVNELYGSVGIEVGQINVQDIDPSFAIISIAEGSTDLEQMVALSNDMMGPGAHVFFVEDILLSDDPEDSIPGVSASVPNPPLMPGTSASGVAISTRGPLSVPQALRFLDPPALGQTLSHELGHALGLSHTSEYDGITHDALPDTIDNDGRYLMHPDGLGSELTPQQGALMMANPQVYHPEE